MVLKLGVIREKKPRLEAVKGASVFISVFYVLPDEQTGASVVQRRAAVTAASAPVSRETTKIRRKGEQQSEVTRW